MENFYRLTEGYHQGWNAEAESMILRKLPLPLLLCCGIAAGQFKEPADPLCRAASRGDVAQVRDLLWRGANPNAPDEQGKTPLMWSAWIFAHLAERENQVKDPDFHGVAKLLLDKGADANARDRAGHTPLLLAMDGVASQYRVV